MSTERHNTKIPKDSDRMERLVRRDRDAYSPARYSSFIRWMRLSLPLAAVIIIAILFIRPGAEEQLIEPITPEHKIPDNMRNQNVSRNELLNPKFESIDKKEQPYQITAIRAVQDDVDPDLIFLEHPSGNITMKDGTIAAVRANTGTYRQNTEHFFLKDNVHLTYSEGYTFQGTEADIDLREKLVRSEKDVKGSGPDMMITAHGLHADGKTGITVFTGPATLTLYNGFEGIE